MQLDENSHGMIYVVVEIYFVNCSSSRLLKMRVASEMLLPFFFSLHIKGCFEGLKFEKKEVKVSKMYSWMLL